MSQNPPSSAAAAVLHDIELSELQASAEGAQLLPQRMDLFAGVKARVSVVAGTAETTIGELLSLKDGAVLALDRMVDAPFDVLLDGRVLARGQLVAVGEHFGIRVSEVFASNPR